MQYNLWFNVCALVMLAELLFLYYMKFNAPFKKYSIFLLMLWCATLSTLASICNNALSGIAPIWVLQLSNTVYFIAHGLITTLLFLYAYSLTDYALADWRKLIPWLIPSAFGFMLILTNWFSGVVFWLDDQGGYHRGVLLPLLYLVTGINFAATTFILVHKKQVIPHRERVSILAFLVVASGAMLYQMLNPIMLVENFACASCLMVSQMTVQNPELVLDGATRMLTKQGFSNLLVPMFDRGERFRVGFLMIDNYHELEKNYGYDRLEKRLLAISNFLKTHSEFTFARMDNSTFCFLEKGARSEEAWDEIMRDLRGKKLFRYLRQQGVGIRFRIKSGELDCPTDADSFSGLMELLNEAAKLPQSQEVGAMRLNTSDVLNLRRRKQIEELTHNAVVGNMLHVVYQPVYNTALQRFTGAEALLRMRTDKLGNVSPAEFIQLAEENGTITEMTRFVVDSVCHFIQSAHLQELGVEHIHVNLSAVDCMQTDLAARIQERLEYYGVDAGAIGIEITETAFSAMPDTIIDSLKSLSQIGVTVLLDDYGTGYSNLSRLMKMPLDVVKLDKTLVDDVMESESARIILDNTIRMMKDLNKRVLMEGVETRQQAEYLMARGCDYIQGYYYAKPMEAAQLESLLRSQKTEEVCAMQA